jgi:hypothetical protein
LEEVAGALPGEVFVADNQVAEVAKVSEKAFDLPTPPVTPKLATVLLGFARLLRCGAISSMFCPASSASSGSLS